MNGGERMRFFEFETSLTVDEIQHLAECYYEWNSILRGIYLKITPLLEKDCIYILMKRVLLVTTKPANVTDTMIYKELKRG